MMNQKSKGLKGNTRTRKALVSLMATLFLKMLLTTL